MKALVSQLEARLSAAADGDTRERLGKRLENVRGQAQWMESTIIEIVISEAQNEVRDFQRWGFNIIPHRVVMKTGFQTPDGRRVEVDDAFKDPQHPFRIAIVCAVWLTGFDVECLSTLYIDKPMKTHTLMQAIARANRVYPGKDCGVIVDYNGMLKSLREALAQYALGDDDEGDDGGEIVAPVEELVKALVQALEAAENHLKGLGFDPVRLLGAKGFDRIQALRDAADAACTSDEARRRFEIMVRQVVIRFKALLMEPSVFGFAERHDNIEAIYKKLEEKRDTADVTDVLKELHKIVNEAIRAQEPGDDQAEGLTVDLSQIDFARLRDEFARKVRRKHAALQDIRDVIEEKLRQMLARNPLRMDETRDAERLATGFVLTEGPRWHPDGFRGIVCDTSPADANTMRPPPYESRDPDMPLDPSAGRPATRPHRRSARRSGPPARAENRLYVASPLIMSPSAYFAYPPDLDGARPAASAVGPGRRLTTRGVPRRDPCPRPAPPRRPRPARAGASGARASPRARRAARSAPPRRTASPRS